MSVACTSINFWSQATQRLPPPLLQVEADSSVCPRLLLVLLLLSPPPALTEASAPHLILLSYSSQLIYFITTVYQYTQTPSSLLISTKKTSLSLLQMMCISVWTPSRWLFPGTTLITSISSPTEAKNIK